VQRVLDIAPRRGPNRHQAVSRSLEPIQCAEILILLDLVCAAYFTYYAPRAVEMRGDVNGPLDWQRLIWYTGPLVSRST
jgi:hypothetical protein